jgi:glycosyltransferase involved in cell wall biosynthesis
MSAFPSIKGIEQTAKEGLGSEKIQYVQYGLAPGIYTLMKKQVDLGARFSVVTQEKEGVPNYEGVEGIEVYRVGRPYNINALKVMKEIEGRVGVDIVHAHATSAIAYALLRMMVKWKPYVIHVHGTTAGVLNAFKTLAVPISKPGMRSRLRREWSLWRERVMWGKGDRVIAVSSNVGSELNQFYDIPQEKIRVVYNGVDIDVFKPLQTSTKQQARRSLGIEHKEMILYVGYLGPRKGLKYLLEAIPKVVKEFPEALFVLLGGVPEFAGHRNYLTIMQQIVSKLQIEDNVLFAGEVKHRDTLKYYAAADAFIFPTLYEGLAKALLEAMSCGLPVIATRIRGNQDAVIDQETGILTRAADSNQLAEATIQLLSNSSQATQMGMRGRNRVKKAFTWNDTAKKIMAIYEELLPTTEKRH